MLDCGSLIPILAGEDVGEITFELEGGDGGDGGGEIGEREQEANKELYESVTKEQIDRLGKAGDLKRERELFMAWWKKLTQECCYKWARDNYTTIHSLLPRLALPEQISIYLSIIQTYAISQHNLPSSTSNPQPPSPHSLH